MMQGAGPKYEVPVTFSAMIPTGGKRWGTVLIRSDLFPGLLQVFGRVLGDWTGGL